MNSRSFNVAIALGSKRRDTLVRCALAGTSIVMIVAATRVCTSRLILKNPNRLFASSARPTVEVRLDQIENQVSAQACDRHS